ncbi:hypothetical protein LZ198_40155 [Myxococcus sp. K15C18031901]|uniref:hypothetical protein n=1 Tax=Myxococcus dinghuensis TaxID=2906761 RepID=UPI0020A6DFE9|nr:hypothetical protein [Myxococcus dinghuensis]MCP3105099.1 hypothetical protein [Myxococcus dinghuensis]
MKPFYAAALLALGLVSCVDKTPEIQILQASIPADDCSVQADDRILRGALNLGLSTGYNLGFIIASNLVDTPIIVGGGQVSDPDSLAVFLREADFSYDTIPNLNIPATTLPIFTAYRPNEDSDMVLNMITTEALNALLGAGGPVEVVIHMRLRGETASGDKVATNEVTFGLIVTNTIYTCPKAGEVHVPRTEACDPRGQNGAVPDCQAP